MIHNKFRKSKYVTEVETINGDLLVHSGLTGAVLKILKEKKDKYRKICSGDFLSSDDKLREDAYRFVFEAFRQSMILVENDFDELGFIRYRQWKSKFSTFNFTIAPTMECNLACPYCYNPVRLGKMTATVQEEVLSFIGKNLAERANDIGAFNLTWVGGEPLLALEVMKELAGKIEKLAAYYGCEVLNSLVTNGVLLNNKALTVLREKPLLMRSIQISLDGPQNMHNKKRKFTNGNPTYDIILRNIRNTSGYIPIGLRINVDNDFSVDVFKNLIQDLIRRDILHPGSTNIGIALGRIHQGCALEGSCFEGIEMQKFARIQEECFEEAKHLGLHWSNSLVPMTKNAYCGADHRYAWAIDSEGYLYKCWEHMGDLNYSVGHVAKPFTYGETKLRKWIDWSPFENKQCVKCHVFPLCGGGCIAQGLSQGWESSERCVEYRFNFKNRLLLQYS